MNITELTVATLQCRVTDTQGELIEPGDTPFSYMHENLEAGKELDGMPLFPRLIEALEGKAAGDEVQIQLEPEDAFGDYDADLLRVEERSKFPADLQVGIQFEGVPGDASAREHGDDDIEAFDEAPLIYTVTDIADDKVIIDGNHPLAGIALRFFITVKAVRAATSEEIVTGRVESLEARITIAPSVEPGLLH